MIFTCNSCGVTGDGSKNETGQAVAPSGWMYLCEGWEDAVEWEPSTAYTAGSHVQVGDDTWIAVKAGISSALDLKQRDDHDGTVRDGGVQWTPLPRYWFCGSRCCHAFKTARRLLALA